MHGVMCCNCCAILRASIPRRVTKNLKLHCDLSVAKSPAKLECLAVSLLGPALQIFLPPVQIEAEASAAKNVPIYESRVRPKLFCIAQRSGESCHIHVALAHAFWVFGFCCSTARMIPSLKRRLLQGSKPFCRPAIPVDPPWFFLERPFQPHPPFLGHSGAALA